MTGVEGAGKILLIAAAVLAVVGLVLWGLGRAGFRGLPGDLRWDVGGATVYVPLATCLVISALLTLALWLWRRWNG